MERNKLIELCEEKGLTHYEIFVTWFMLRFPNESCVNYTNEWIDRFNKGVATTHMDLESKKLYFEVIKNK